MSNWTGWQAARTSAPSGPSAQAQATAEREKRTRRRKAVHSLDFVHDVTPRWERPDHLPQIGDAFERIKAGEEIKVCFSVPPRHGKTETLLHCMVQLLLREPQFVSAYVSYAADFAYSRSRIAQGIAARARVQRVQNTGTAHEWLTTEGGGIIATGIGGQLTGRGVDRLLVVDDPFKDRAEAESSVIRNKVYDWFSGVALERLHPGASVIVCHTRWHDDDLIGRLSALRKDDGTPAWLVINLPALGDGLDGRAVGEPLWHKRPAKFFAGLREAGLSDYDWESQYMGRPRPRGAQVFKGVTYYDTLPSRFRIGKGIDLAYTAKTRADKSVAVSLLRDGDLHYVVDARRAQLELDAFYPQLVQQSAVYPGTYLFYSSSTEQGIAQLSRLLPDKSVRIQGKHADVDKFTRAQPCATAWNQKKILLPSKIAQEELKKRGLDTKWVPEFIRVVERFTGVSDAEDDDVDALAAAFDQVSNAGGTRQGRGVVPGVPLDDRPVGV